MLVRPVPEALAGLAEHYTSTAHLEALLHRRDERELRVLAEFLAELTGPAPAVSPDPRAPRSGPPGAPRG